MEIEIAIAIEPETEIEHKTRKEKINMLKKLIVKPFDFMVGDPDISLRPNQP